MGTRGVLGFRLNGQDKVTYNHFDSYPEHLGTTMVNFAKQVAEDIESYKVRVERLTLVDENDPVDEDVLAQARALDLVNKNVGNQSDADWYCVLRGAQGQPETYLILGVMPDWAGFLKDSLFCEYAYIINLDDETLEFYKGFNTEPNQEGRYAKSDGEKPYQDADYRYYGVRLVGTAPLDAIPNDWQAQFYPDPDEDNEEAA